MSTVSQEGLWQTGRRDKWSTSGNALLEVGTGGDWGSDLLVSGLVGGDPVDLFANLKRMLIRNKSRCSGAIWASLLGVTDFPWLVSGSAIREPSIPSCSGPRVRVDALFLLGAQPLERRTKMTLVVGIWSAYSLLLDFILISVLKFKHRRKDQQWPIRQ